MQAPSPTRSIDSDAAFDGGGPRQLHQPVSTMERIRSYIVNDAGGNKFLDRHPRCMVQWRVDSYALYRRLEQRFDGEIPDRLRHMALAGGAAAFEAALARADSRCCDALALSAVRAAAARRSHTADLSLLRRAALDRFAAGSSSASSRDSHGICL